MHAPTHRSPHASTLSLHAPTHQSPHTSTHSLHALTHQSPHASTLSLHALTHQSLHASTLSLHHLQAAWPQGRKNNSEIYKKNIDITHWTGEGLSHTRFKIVGMTSIELSERGCGYSRSDHTQSLPHAVLSVLLAAPLERDHLKHCPVGTQTPLHQCVCVCVWWGCACVVCVRVCVCVCVCGCVCLCAVCVCGGGGGRGDMPPPQTFVPVLYSHSRSVTGEVWTHSQSTVTIHLRVHTE